MREEVSKPTRPGHRVATLDGGVAPYGLRQGIGYERCWWPGKAVVGSFRAGFWAHFLAGKIVE